jgi:hypothetical protein
LEENVREKRLATREPGVGVQTALKKLTNNAWVLLVVLSGKGARRPCCDASPGFKKSSHDIGVRHECCEVEALVQVFIG